MPDPQDSSRKPSAESARRAEVVSLIGLFLQLLFFVVILLVGLWNGSTATFGSAFFMLGGVIVWVAILLIYHQEKLVYLEALEAEQIDRDREAIGAEALFAEGREGIDALLVARSRLRWMHRWMLPLFGLLTSVYLIAMGVYLYYWYLDLPIGSDEWPPVVNASITLAFVGGVAFVSFLFSRYTVGMARIQGLWYAIRAGGSYMTGGALICGLTAGMLGFASYGKVMPERVLAVIIPIVMVVIGAETVLNLVLDVYRPRRRGEIARPAFDSRLMGLISEPGGIARTIADAMNYQFGFEVSKTWFYQLLERWALVLIGAALVVLFVMSAVVIVEPGEQAVVERFGKPLGLMDKSIRALEPGIHLKLPWPVDRATRYKVDKIQTVLIGFGSWKRRPKQEYQGTPRLILWTNPIHGPGEELDFVMPVRAEVEQAVLATQPAAATQEGREEGPETPAVNLIRIGLPVMYRVRDLYQYAFSYTNPETLIESAAYGELVKYVASKDLDDLLAVERRRASEELQRQVQAKCDALGVGVEITFVGLQNIHPPQKVAEDFEAYLNAKYEKGAAIEKAEGLANKILTEVAGDRRRAERLAGLIAQVQRLMDGKASEAEVAKARDDLERLFAGRPGDVQGVSGEAAVMIAVARADRWFVENKARARSISFMKELKAYRSAPKLYKMRKIVDVLISGLRDAKKFVIAREGEVYTRYDAIERDQVQLEDIDYNVQPG